MISLPPPQTNTVEIFTQVSEDFLSKSSDRINEFQLKLEGYYKLSNPVTYNKRDVIVHNCYKLTEIENDWDGFSAVAPYNECVNNCIKFINKLPSEIIDELIVGDITPTNYGTVTLNLSNKFNEIVSIEFGKTKIGFYSRFNDETNYQIDEIRFNNYSLPSKLTSAISKLYKGTIL